MLTVLVTPAEVQDNQPALDLLWRTRFRWRLRLRQVTGDTKYGTVANVAAIDRERIRAYVPLSDVGHRSAQFRDTDFVYDAATDACRCLGEQTLQFLSQSDATLRRMYQAPASACAACALRTQCTASPRGRRVSRSLDEDALDRVRSHHSTAS